MLFPLSPGVSFWGVSFFDSFFFFLGRGEASFIEIDCECIISIIIFHFMFQIFREFEEEKFGIYCRSIYRLTTTILGSFGFSEREQKHLPIDLPSSRVLLVRGAIF